MRDRSRASCVIECHNDGNRTSDHWFKEGHTEDKAHPSVFFSKIIGDNFYIEDLEAKNLSSIKKLITNYLNDEIKSNNDIRSFFKKEKNHGSYVR